MNYDPTIHLSTDQFADLLGIPVSELNRVLWTSSGTGAPRRLGRANVSGRQQSVYDREAAVEWIDSQRASTIEPPKGERVPPREYKPVQDQGVYRPSPMLLINQQRAAELYGHRLMAPPSVGNDRQLMFDGHQKARL